LVFGVLGVLWAATWFLYYRDTPEEHAGVNEAERQLIGIRKRSSAKVPWREILRQWKFVDPGADVLLLQLQSERFIKIGFRRICTTRAA